MRQACPKHLPTPPKKNKQKDSPSCQGLLAFEPGFCLTFKGASVHPLDINFQWISQP